MFQQVIFFQQYFMLSILEAMRNTRNKNVLTLKISNSMFYFFFNFSFINVLSCIYVFIMYLLLSKYSLCLYLKSNQDSSKESDFLYLVIMVIISRAWGLNQN